MTAEPAPDAGRSCRGRRLPPRTRAAFRWHRPGARKDAAGLRATGTRDACGRTAARAHGRREGPDHRPCRRRPTTHPRTSAATPEEAASTALHSIYHAQAGRCYSNTGFAGRRSARAAASLRHSRSHRLLEGGSKGALPSWPTTSGTSSCAHHARPKRIDACATSDLSFQHCPQRSVEHRSRGGSRREPPVPADRVTRADSVRRNDAT